MYVVCILYMLYFVHTNTLIHVNLLIYTVIYGASPVAQQVKKNPPAMQEM